MIKRLTREGRWFEPSRTHAKRLAEPKLGVGIAHWFKTSRETQYGDHIVRNRHF